MDTSTKKIRAISLFTGGGGFELGAILSGGIQTICYVENDEYCQAVILANIRRGVFFDAPIWDDVKTFDGKPWQGQTDLIYGGFPCTDVSTAGKRAGIIKGKRSSLWKEFHRIICEVRPRAVLIENVRGLVRNGLGIVLKDLSSAGYDAEWTVISASDVGAPHKRERVWIVAYAQEYGHQRGESFDFCEADGRQGRTLSSISSSTSKMANPDSARRLTTDLSKPEEWECNFKPLRASEVAYNQSNGRDSREPGSSREAGYPDQCGEGVADTDKPRLEKRQCEPGYSGTQREAAIGNCQDWWHIDPTEHNWTVGPAFLRVVNGMANRSHRITVLGNGVVPAQAVPAFERVKEILKGNEK